MDVLGMAKRLPLLSVILLASGITATATQTPAHGKPSETPQKRFLPSVGRHGQSMTTQPRSVCGVHS